MANELRFDGRVAIITGAGNGLGRSHALLLASRGARVVVNDLGGSAHGEGKSSAAADKVVEEIKAAGGQAVANYDSVEDGDKIVQCALDNFKQIDIVINNAGILRDVSFQKMSQQDWDLIYRVHVLGSFRVTHAAWPHMRDKEYGRIVMTASAAGIYGNFGQANYSMAKLGIHGFAQTLALEGKKKNVIVNTIAPIAGSRMTETVLPKELIDALKPEYVSPLVAYLCHDSCSDSGGLYEVGGGFVGKLRWERAEGASFRLSRQLTPEQIADKWKAITDFSKSTHPADVTQSMAPVLANIGTAKGKGGNEFIDVDEALGYQFPESKETYTERDLALYALATGAASQNPLDASELRTVFEAHGEGFVALPTYGVIPALNAMMKAGQAPGMNYGFERILHGEQYLELSRPLPTSGTLIQKAKIKDIWDKGKNAVVVTEVTSFDSSGNQLMRNEITAVVRGAGGWGGDRGPATEQASVPDRKPDAEVSEKTTENQALLYRLTGDINPLHADPGFAGAMGFKKPILHGLCTFGFSARHVVKAFAKNDPRYLKSIKARFSDSVYPGETLKTEMWKESDTRIAFRTKVVERDVVVISGGVVELWNELPSQKPAQAAQPAAQATAAAPGPQQPEASSRNAFAVIGHYIEKNPDLAAKIGTSFQFKLGNPDSSWVIDLKNGKGEVREGSIDKPDVTLELSDADFLGMSSGKLDAQKLYFGGKLKIAGNVMASQKLTFMQKMDREAVLKDAIAAGKVKMVGGGAAAAPAAAGAPASGGAPEASSTNAFKVIGFYIEKNPDLVAKVGTTFQFKLTGPDSQWFIDLKHGKGNVGQGTVDHPDVTLELSDADFLGMSSGKLDAQKLYFGGKLKISGNVMASQKLMFMQKMDREALLKEALAAGVLTAGQPVAASADVVPGAQDAVGGQPEVSAKNAFAVIGFYVEKNPDLVAKVATSFQFKLSNPDSSWVIDLKNGKGEVREGSIDKPDVTLELSDADFLGMSSGKLDAQKLYFGGKLKIAGNVMASQKLTFMQKMDREALLKEAIAAGRVKVSGGGGQAAAPAAAAAQAAPAQRSAKAPELFAAVKASLAKNPGLAGEIGALVQFRVKSPNSAWVLDLKGGGGVREGEDKAATTVVTIAEEDLEAMLKGQAQLRDLYQHGKLRVDGDIRPAQKLGLLRA